MKIFLHIPEAKNNNSMTQNRKITFFTITPFQRIYYSLTRIRDEGEICNFCIFFHRQQNL